MGGGKEDLIDKTQVLAVCACATSSPVWRAENICRHRPLGGAVSTHSPRAHPPAARTRAHAARASSAPPAPGPQLPGATAGRGWAGGSPTGLRLGGWAWSTPSPMHRPLCPLKRMPTVTSRNPPVAATPRKCPEGLWCPTLWGSPERYREDNRPKGLSRTRFHF